jgi:hypothetical protein
MLGVKIQNWGSKPKTRGEIRFNFFFFCTFYFSLGTLGVLFWHTFGTFFLPLFLGRLKWGFLGTLIDFLLVGGLKGGLFWFFFPFFWGRLKGVFGTFFELFFLAQFFDFL